MSTTDSSTNSTETNVRQPEPAALDQRAANRFIRLMSIAGGLSVANMYYNQPLLAEMGRTFSASARGVGLIAAMTQIGYAVGMLLVVPLGDMMRRQRLVPGLLVLVSVALGAAAISRNLPWMVAASFAIGVTTVVPQVLIPLVAQLAPPAARGRAIGTVMMGVLLGILLSRTLSGFIGGHFGWRIMYGLAAGLMLLLAAGLGPFLPVDRVRSHLSYPRLLRSMCELVRREPVLRQAMVNGSLLFAAFSAFWATLVFRLEAPPLHYGATAAGMFGLVGAAGALVAPVVGRMADRIKPRSILTLAIGLMMVSYAIFWMTGSKLWGLAIGVILLDVATQGAIVSNQARIYSLSADSHSRVNGAFMVAYFAGGATGSLLGTWGWSVARWDGVCILGVLLAATAMVAHLAVGWVTKARPAPGALVSSN